MGAGMMRPKLILTDLDGTLLRNDKSLSPANRAALERAAAQGAQVVIATGRIYRGIPDFLRELPFLRYFILMNGAKVWDRQEDRVLYRAELPLETAERIFDLMEGEDATVDCFQNDEGLMDRRYLEHLEHYIRDAASRQVVRMSRTPQKDFRGRVRAGGGSVQKIQCYFPDLERRRAVKERLEREFPHIVLSISMPENLEINAEAATKGRAMLELCRALGVDPADTAAFGDGTNDVSMLRAAGVGVAMANAAPEAMSAADLTAPSNQADGVAEILKSWFAAE